MNTIVYNSKTLCIQTIDTSYPVEETYNMLPDAYRETTIRDMAGIFEETNDILNSNKSLAHNIRMALHNLGYSTSIESWEMSNDSMHDIINNSIDLNNKVKDAREEIKNILYAPYSGYYFVENIKTIYSIVDSIYKLARTFHEKLEDYYNFL